MTDLTPDREPDIRAQLAKRRAYGLRRRHAAKIAHFEQHGWPDHLATLAAKVATRMSTNQSTEETET